MKLILSLATLALISGTGYFGYLWFSERVQSQIGRWQSSDRIIQRIRDQLTSEEGCHQVLSSPSLLRPPYVSTIEGEHKAALALIDRVDLSPSDKTLRFQARLKVSLSERSRDLVLGFVQVQVDDHGQIRTCHARPVNEKTDEQRPCPADNSPDPLRPGGKANRVSAPHGTLAMAGPHASPVFEFAGVVKWLESPNCGVINLCYGGHWTTVGVRSCPSKAE